MFNKLLANLPFNPSLVTQISFYGQRLKRESSIRRLGFVFVALAVAVQIFAIASPPQASLAASTNDIIFGGFHGTDPKANLLRIYDANSDGHNTGFQALYTSFSITRQDIVNSQLSTINSSDHTLYSLGRNPHSALDQAYNVGSQHYFLRPLYTWGNGISYQVLSGTRSGVSGTTDDKYFSVMLDCGNIVIKFRSQPKLSPPVKVARTENGLPAAGTTVAPGQLIGYRVFFNNTGAGIAHTVNLVDNIPNNTIYSSHGGGGATNGGQHVGNQVIWEWDTMPAQAQNWYVDLNVTVAPGTPDGTQICNIAYLSSLENARQPSNQICHTVRVPVKPLPPPPPPPPPAPGQPDISQSKLANNLTQNLTDAQTKPANPGDIIQYQLLTLNKGTADAPNYQVSDNVNDILEYADVTEISDGGKLASGLVSWPAATIKANTTLTRTFKIKVGKGSGNIIPSTPTPPTDPQSFDLKMDNVYGNEVTINVQPPTVAKTVEQVTTALPNTGPGASLIIGFGLMLIVGYFFARSRLLSKEAELVRVDYAHNGDIA